MTIMSSWLRKQLKKQTAGCLVLLLAVPLADAAIPPQQSPSIAQQAQGTNGPQPQPQAPGTEPAKPAANNVAAETGYPDSPSPVPRQAPAQSPQSPSNPQQNPATPSDQQQNPPQKPVGTAAAPEEKPTGVAASRPAGAVIAPAKQKRARIILIRTAIVIGAAVAVGTVVALSKGSPSRPN